MDRKRSVWVFIVWFLVTAVIAAGFFFLGRNLESQKAAAAVQAEREYNILLNLSDLEGLEEFEGPVYVTGHKSPDSDTVGSSIGYASLLQKLGYDARAVVLGDINHESAYILKMAGLDTPPRLDDASGLNMILVDHSEYIHSADGLEDARIISIIDHHGDGSVYSAIPFIYDARPIGATATIVWLRYRNYGVEPDPQVAMVMLGSVLSDTKNLKSDTTTFADREAVKVLSGLAGVEDTDALFQEMFKASLSYEGMTDEQIFFGDYKEYTSGGVSFSIGVINVYDQADAAAMAERMKAVLPETLTASGMDMAFAQISIFHDDLSYSYIVPSDEKAADVLTAAFGDQGIFDGTSYILNPGISRKKILVPAISDVLAAHPGE